MRTSVLGLVRSHLHPLHNARRLPGVAPLLQRVDVPVWATLEGIAWPVRIRVLRHAAYRIRGAQPEREVAALACAVVDVLGVGRFCDVGSNFGYYAWLLKSRAPELVVDLVEPDPNNLALIDATLGRAILSSVTVHRAAVSDRAGTGRFQRDPVSGATGTLEPAAESFSRRHWGQAIEEEVPTVILDEILPSGAEFVKLDVEGHEERALAGAARMLSDSRPTIVFECFHGGREVEQMLVPLGYEIYDAETLAPATPVTDNFFGLPAKHREKLDDLRARRTELVASFETPRLG